MAGLKWGISNQAPNMKRGGGVHGSSDDYVRSLNQRIGAEVKKRRKALGLSAYSLGQGADGSYNQSQMQDVLNKLDKLINALRR